MTIYFYGLESTSLLWKNLLLKNKLYVLPAGINNYICLKIKDLHDGFKVMFELKTPENKVFTEYIMTAGDTKKFVKKIKERNKRKTE